MNNDGEDMEIEMPQVQKPDSEEQIRVRAVVYLADRQGNLLLLRRADSGHWSLPGGLLRAGESLVEAARRGTLEQTGLVLAGLELVNVFSGKQMTDRSPAGEVLYYVSAAFLPDAAQGKIHVNSQEFSEVRFFATWNLPHDQFYPVDAPAVAHFVERYPGGRPQTLEDMRTNRAGINRINPEKG